MTFTVLALGTLYGPPGYAQSGSISQPDSSSRVHLGMGNSQLEQLPVPADGAEPIGGVGTAPSVGQAGDTSTDGRKSELIFAPIPISSEAVGIGLAPVAALVFFPSRSDRISPPSTLALAGLITSTKTYGLGFGGLFNLKEDRYRLTFLIGGARARYEFFGIGNTAATAGQSAWLSQRGRAIFFQGLRRIKWNVFGGLRFSHRQLKADNETPFENPGPLPPIQSQLNLSITTAAMGVRLERDTRDDMFYPTRGSRVDGRADFFGPYVGSRFTFQSYQFEINDYIRMAKRHVLAVRAMGCGVAGDRIPFFELCQFGWMGDLRGYQTGRYRDRAMVATQGEWRVALTKRLGTALFGGVGEVAPDGTSFNAKDLLPSGGCGLRLNLSKQRRINLRLDLAYSKTGPSWSMGLGEAF